MSRSPVSFGPYVITRRIARGGMAEIFRARVRADGSWVALKMMRPSLGHEDLREQLFKREARIAAAIAHPNVVRLIEFGKEADRYFLAMEYIRGRDLTSLIASPDGQREGLSYELGLFVGLEASRGLGHAHRLKDEKGAPLSIVHRDISPGNVMVGYDGSVKVLDFGVARMNESEGVRTQTGTLRGKFAYMSPEQTLGLGVDARSDVFALGTLLYELLTGGNPFRARTPLKTIERVQRVRPAPPSRADRRVPKDLDEILARCLAKDPSRRFGDAMELHDALAEFLARQSLRDGREKLAALVTERFSWEKSEEERELREEEEEVALLEVVDFALTGGDVSLDARRVVVSEEQEASQQEVNRNAVEVPEDESELGVFDARETARLVVPSVPMGAEPSATAPNIGQPSDAEETGPRNNPESPPAAPPPMPLSSALGEATAPMPDARERSKSVAPKIPEMRVRKSGKTGETPALRPSDSAPKALEAPKAPEASKLPAPDQAPTAAMLPEDALQKAREAIAAKASLPARADSIPMVKEEAANKGADPMLLAIAASGPKAVTTVPFSDDSPSRIGIRVAAAAALLAAIGGGAFAVLNLGQSQDPPPPGPSRVAAVLVPDASEEPDAAPSLPDANLPDASSPDRAEPDAAPAPEPPRIEPEVRPPKPPPPRAEKRRPPPPPQKKQPPGFLNVGATPWASIEIDGKPWPYQTPQAGIELPAGRHTLRLSNRDTGVSKTVTVIIKSGASKTVSLDLSKP